MEGGWGTIENCVYRMGVPTGWVGGSMVVWGCVIIGPFFCSWPIIKQSFVLFIAKSNISSSA